MREKEDWIESFAILLASAVVSSVVTVVLFPFLLFLVVWTAVFILTVTFLHYLIEKFKNGGKKWDWK